MEEKEEEKEKIPLCESIGHRPLWGRCPAPTLHYNLDLPKQGTGTADHLTLLRLLFSRIFFLSFRGTVLSTRVPVKSHSTVGFFAV